MAVGTELISIRPESGILAVLSHLNYRPWYALAEFVDNSIQSFLSERQRIEEHEGLQQNLEVTIRLDGTAGCIVIRDNAGGIAWPEFPRAFKAAQIPPDTTGLCEYGLGMKLAACWFARRWAVRTSALGESAERTVVFDVDEIQRTDTESIEVFTTPVNAGAHYTEITLERLNHGLPQRRTLGKIREHLRDIYRCYTRDGLLELYLETDTAEREQLTFEERAVLFVPTYGRNNEPVDEPPREWKKSIRFDFGNNCSAEGFAGLAATADTKRAGLSLFRRRRLIVGSGDEPYRPAEVFGGPNDYPYQRVFGELQVRGLPVAHTKDGFRWGPHEEDFLECLRRELDSEPLPLIKQANNYRARPRKGTQEATTLQKSADEAATRVAQAIQGSASPEINRQAADESEPPPEPETLEATDELVSERVVEVRVLAKVWTIRLEYVDMPAQGSLVEVADHPDYRGPRELSFRFNMAHPFALHFRGANNENLELLSCFAAAIALAEKTTQLAGPDNQAARMRANLSDILRVIPHSAV